MDNRYLRDRARRRRDSARRRSRSRDRAYDYTYDQHYTPMPQHYMDHTATGYVPDQHHMGSRMMYPTSYNVGHYIYGPDGSDYDDEKEYHKELEEWVYMLKEHDRFKLPKEEVINKAKTMGARFHGYDEMEFYATYLMLITTAKQIASDPHSYVIAAKEWLEDTSTKRRGSEKLCAYLYSIVLGEDDD